MANVKITELPAVSSLTGAEQFAMVSTSNVTSSANSAVILAYVNGNVTSVGTLSTLSVTGNITGNYFLGNGSQLTGLPATYANSNVAAYLPTYTGNITANIISTTGNITGSYLLGNGSQITGLPAGYSNTQVAEYLASGTNSSDISITGNVIGANIQTGGQVSATGNVTGASLIGTIATANQSAITTIGTLSSLSVTGVAQAGNVNSNGTLSATGNITGGNVTTSGMVSVGGNIAAGNLSIIDGSIIHSGNLILDPSAGNAVIVTTGRFRLPSFTTAQLGNLTGVPGDLVYNTTTNTVQAWQYNATSTFAWVSLAVPTYQ